MRCKSEVAVVYCSSYDEQTVYDALKAGLDALGGIERFVSKDQKILVKPNFLSASEPEKAIITHPSVIKAMLRILSENGCSDVCCGDSPGHGSPENAASKADLDGAFEEYGIESADMSTEVSFSFEEGMTARHFWFTKAAAECDAVINLCKMKTHALERITGAVKNVYGLICGYRKAQGHVQYPNESIFARMLCDIHRARNISLNVMDAVTAMEGNGPGSGTPVDMNLLIISDDPVAADSIFCRLVDLDPKLVPTCVQGKAMGTGNYDYDEIKIIEVRDGRTEVIDDDTLFERYGNREFDVDRTGSKKTFLSRFLDIMTKFSRKPYVDKEKCIGCGICEVHCPVAGKAVSLKNGKGKPPVYDYRKCIRCYCCQEMCPENAIKVKGKR